MVSSSRKINYSLRPAKQIERKMLVESLRRLNEFQRIEHYRYIGFGSFYFADFLLIHKSLGISDMLSIEREKSITERSIFNRPFKCVEMRFEESNSVLPTLKWDIPTIMWLDYDGKLESSVLTDVAFFCANASPGSVIIISVNMHPGKFETALGELRENVGTAKVPVDVNDKDLRQSGTGTICRRIIINEILDTLNTRNGGIAPGSRIQYQQLFNFHYADDAPMLTTGGLIYEVGQEEKVDKCGFKNLRFIRTGMEFKRSDEGILQDDAYKIAVPNLTYRELRHLDAQLPNGDIEKIVVPGIPKADVEKYAEIYRYFPTYAETEI